MATKEIKPKPGLVRKRKELGLRQEDVAKAIGVTKATVQRYEAGIISIPYDRIEPLADVLGVNPLFIVTDGDESGIATLPPAPRIPLLGAIACGVPILAVEEAEETVALPDGVRADFALTAKGDSMITARIFDGDTVYIRSQEMVEAGQIAAVLVEDEATLKRVYYDESAGRMVLRPCNPLYPDLVYTGPELDRVKILGLAVAFTSMVRHDDGK